MGVRRIGLLFCGDTMGSSEGVILLRFAIIGHRLGRVRISSRVAADLAIYHRKAGGALGLRGRFRERSASDLGLRAIRSASGTPRKCRHGSQPRSPGTLMSGLRRRAAKK